jgi:hypothetical protein
MVAPICASTFIDPRRSSRDVSESCSVFGSATFGKCALERVFAGPFRQEIAVEQRLGQLLQKERHAIAALEDLLREFARERLAADYSRDDRGTLAPAKTRE